MLRGKCRNCAAPISARYFFVELFTGVLFLSCWLALGRQSPALALAYCLLLSAFIAATFIDFEHFIIPDEITLGGTAAGFLCSFLVPALHGTQSAALSLERSFYGIIAGAGLVYGILRLGKLLYGRQRFEFAPDTRVYFTETAVIFPTKRSPTKTSSTASPTQLCSRRKLLRWPTIANAKVRVRLSPRPVAHR